MYRHELILYVAVIAFCVQMESGRETAQVEPSISSGCELKTELAVVLYDPVKVLPMHRPTMRYEICNRTIEIEQGWSELGVSAVVWDAVRMLKAVCFTFLNLRAPFAKLFPILQAPFLSYYLEKTPAIVQGKRVIELGAGTGLVSMVSNMLGKYQ